MEIQFFTTTIVLTQIKLIKKKKLKITSARTLLYYFFNNLQCLTLT